MIAERQKPAAPDDPMALIGVALAGGDPETMVRCLIEEYMLLGFSRQRLQTLFRRPCFQGTHRLYLALGEERIEALIDAVYGGAAATTDPEQTA